MPSSYLPVALPAFQIFVDNFAALIAAAPGVYGLSAGDSAAISAVVADFDAAYALSSVPATRTKVTVADTTNKRNATVAVVRAYGRIILANGGVDPADKTALGLIIRDLVPTPIPAPLTNPNLAILGATPGQLTMTYHDSAAAPKIKAKPFGAIAMEVHAFFGTVAPATPAATPYAGLVTRTPFALDTSGATPGQTAYVYGRWITAKGIVGPWSPIATSAII